MPNPLGDKIIELRESIGLAQKGFAEATSLSQGYISQLESENYHHSPRFPIINLMTETFVQLSVPRADAIQLYEVSGMGLVSLSRNYAFSRFLSGPSEDQVIRYSSLADAIKGLRKQKGISQSELTRKGGISQGYLSQLEYDEVRQPTSRYLGKLAKGLDTTPGELTSLLLLVEPVLDEEMLLSYVDGVVIDFTSKIREVHEGLLAGTYGNAQKEAYQIAVDMEELQSADPTTEDYYRDLRERSRDFREATLRSLV